MFVFFVVGKLDVFIFMGDWWCFENVIDGCYVWLLVEFCYGVLMLCWYDFWMWE